LGCLMSPTVESNTCPVNWLFPNQSNISVRCCNSCTRFFLSEFLQLQTLLLRCPHR
jgi:hypothetical protein